MPKPAPWAPDFYVLDIGFPVFAFVAFEFQPLIVDKYGNFYIAGGPGVGTSPIPGLKANFSYTGGYIIDDNTTEAEVESFLQTWTVSAPCVGFIGGVCGAWRDPGLTQENFELRDFALQVGEFSPQVGGSATYGLLLYDNGSSTPWIWQK